MEKDNAWRTMFFISQGNTGHWLVIENGKCFSYNCHLYQTKSGAIMGAKACFRKINKEFEKIMLSSK